MKWFPGSINEAVTTAKQRGAIFVVFIEGRDESSTEAARVLEREENSSRMDRADFVAVRVQEDAEAFDFFKQIYGSVAVPSLHFIGTNGAPLNVLSGDFGALSSTLDAVLEKGRATPVVPSTSAQVEKTSVEEDAGEAAPSGSPDASTDLTTEEKIERAKRLVEVQRKRKMEQEREEEKKREIERRRTGKDVQALKRRQHDAEVKLALDERMREKAAEAEARERVLRQIAQDKLERKQRQIAFRQQVAHQSEAKDSPVAASSSTASRPDPTIARIQFRLPSGSPHLEKFDAASTLGQLRSYVADNIELPFREFTMSTTFPRHDLTTEDDEKTLTELELVPTAVILILPVKNSKITSAVSASTSDDAGFVSRFVWALFAPIFSIYNYVMGYFAIAPTNNNNNNNNNSTGRSTRTDRIGNSSNENSARLPGRASYDQTTGNLLGGPSTTIRSRGNVHRLHSGGDENDENNTWNGNSTQQM